MAWRLARSLEVLRDQINTQWPIRAKGNDGTIGDERHAATLSDHNPNANGVVTAMDITRDTAHGLDSRKVAQAILDLRDPRIKYVISDGQICSATVSPWVWRKYTGADPHDHHFHISVDKDYDDPRPWKFLAAMPVQVPGRFSNIIATEFGGSTDPEHSAYDNEHLITDTELGVSLPARIADPRRSVRVIKGSRSVVCPIIDVGPWNINDPYWVLGTRPQAETGTDLTGRKTNRAGIDLTPATMNALGVPGPLGTRSVVVDWEFVSLQPSVVAPSPPPPTKEPSMNLLTFLPLLMRILNILPQIQEAMKSGSSIITLLTKFAPDLLGILTQIGGTLFPELPAPAQTQVGGLMMDPLKVQLIQKKINRLGLANPALIEDGSYGVMTKKAVTAFQTAHNVVPADGWAGDQTTAALDVEIAKLNAPAPAPTPAAPTVNLSL
jgi:hypothetical protein